MTGHAVSKPASSPSLRLELDMQDLLVRLRNLHDVGDRVEDGIALIDEAALRLADARALAEDREAALRHLLDRSPHM